MERASLPSSPAVTLAAPAARAATNAAPPKRRGCNLRFGFFLTNAPMKWVYKPLRTRHPRASDRPPFCPRPPTYALQAHLQLPNSACGYHTAGTCHPRWQTSRCAIGVPALPRRRQRRTKEGAPEGALLGRDCGNAERRVYGCGIYEPAVSRGGASERKSARTSSRVENEMPEPEHALHRVKKVVGHR